MGLESYETRTSTFLLKSDLIHMSKITVSKARTSSKKINKRNCDVDSVAIVMLVFAFSCFPILGQTFTHKYQHSHNLCDFGLLCKFFSNFYTPVVTTVNLRQTLLENWISLMECFCYCWYITKSKLFPSFAMLKDVFSYMKRQIGWQQLRIWFSSWVTTSAAKAQWHLV